VKAREEGLRRTRTARDRAGGGTASHGDVASAAKVRTKSPADCAGVPFAKRAPEGPAVVRPHQARARPPPRRSCPATAPTGPPRCAPAPGRPRCCPEPEREQRAYLRGGAPRWRAAQAQASDAAEPATCDARVRRRGQRTKPRPRCQHQQDAWERPWTRHPADARLAPEGQELEASKAPQPAEEAAPGCEAAWPLTRWAWPLRRQSKPRPADPQPLLREGHQGGATAPAGMLAG